MLAEGRLEERKIAASKCNGVYIPGADLSITGVNWVRKTAKAGLL